MSPGPVEFILLWEFLFLIMLSYGSSVLTFPTAKADLGPLVRGRAVGDGDADGT